jgi:hypothetical protein
VLLDDPDELPDDPLLAEELPDELLEDELPDEDPEELDEPEELTLEDDEPLPEPELPDDGAGSQQPSPSVSTSHLQLSA